jgi:hypothetical protein
MANTGHPDQSTNSLPNVQETVELTYTADQIVKQYIALRNAKKEIAKRHADELAPYKAAMEALEGYAATMMRMLNTTLSTPYGSAFWHRSWSYKLVDFEKFWPWVVKEKQQQMLTRHLAQEAVVDWIEVQKSMAKEGEEIKLPPGVTADYNVEVHFRKG